MGGYRYGGYRNWNSHGMSKRRAVSITCGGIDDDILDVFLNLDQRTRIPVFIAYERAYGKSAADYAERTYKKWKAGIVRPSGLTLERLIDTLPPLLSFDAKCELLRKLRERNRKKEFHRLKVDTSNWANAITPIVSRLVGRAYSAELPEIVEQRLHWLSSGDMQVAKAILTEAEAQEGKNTVALLRQEFQNIEALLSSLPRGGKVTHMIKLPYGDIELIIKRPRNMREENKGIVPKPKTDSLFRPTADEIFDSAFENLDHEQAQKISAKAADEAIRIVADKKRAEQKFDNAKKDIGRFIDDTRKMDQGSGDYDMYGSFESASGVTNIKVSRQRSTTATVIAVVVGLILVLYFLSR